MKKLTVPVIAAAMFAFAAPAAIAGCFYSTESAQQSTQQSTKDQGQTS
ncbi:MAG: hypothetical protein AAF577_04360 [Pseudomonadota bacterium]